MTNEPPPEDEAQESGFLSPGSKTKKTITVDPAVFEAGGPIRLDDPPEGFEEMPDSSVEDVRIEDESQAEPDPEDDQPVDDQGFPISELTAEERQSLSQLMTVGRRSKKFDLFDFTIHIQTMNCDDEIRVGRYTKPYRDSDAYSRAYQVAVVASAIRSVNGDSWNNTLVQNPDADAIFDKKVDKVLKFYPLVVSYIYDEYLKLESEFAELARKLGKL